MTVHDREDKRNHDLRAEDQVSRAYLVWALARARRKEEALETFGELERRRGEHYFAGWLMAHVNLGRASTIESSLGWNRQLRNATR